MATVIIATLPFPALADPITGPITAHVVSVYDGERLASVLIAEGLGREYHGGAREGWCE